MTAEITQPNDQVLAKRLQLVEQSIGFPGLEEIDAEDEAENEPEAVAEG